MPPNLWKQEKQQDETGTSGVWIDYADGIRLLLGSVETDRYKKVHTLVNEEVRSQYKNRVVPDAVGERKFDEVYADSIVLGWEGMTDENGAPLEFTRDNVLKVLGGLKRLRAFVVTFANERRNFTVAIEDDATKNSSTASPSGSSGAVH